jgi:opacity protein-like surface antigen
MLASSIIRAALLIAVVAASALAQDSASCDCRPVRQHTPNEFELRSSGSFSFIQSRPAGAFRNNIGFGYGGNAAYMFRLDREGFLSLRADAGILGYGSEHFNTPLSSTIGGRIQVKVSTTNYIVPLSIGPQLAWPTGKFRPYVNAGVGAQAFFTESNVEGSDDSWEFANTTNQSDWTSSWVAGGGVYMPIYEGKTKVSIDLGVQYHNGGRAQYLKPGSIQDLPDAQIRVTPLESDTHMMLVRLGVRIGL